MEQDADTDHEQLHRLGRLKQYMVEAVELATVAFEEDGDERQVFANVIVVPLLSPLVNIPPIAPIGATIDLFELRPPCTPRWYSGIHLHRRALATHSNSGRQHT